jgi:hypothetical protein
MRRMLKPINIQCEICGSQADAIMSHYVDAQGNPIKWPKATVKEDGIYFVIDCPNCGERDQRMATPSDTVDE